MFSNIDTVSVTSEISVIFQYFLILFTDDYMSTIEYRIWQCDMSVTSVLVPKGR